MTATNTPRTLIEFAEDRFTNAQLFYGHGTDNAADEAFYLVMTALKLDFNCEESELDEVLQANDVERVRALINRRIEERVPVGYLVNEAWFAGLPFYVDERVLIPRSPIAELILERFQPWVEAGNVKRILDIGTGSACIPIACAYAFAEADVDAVDIEADALVVANKNVAMHELQQRVHLYQSNLFNALPEKQYDIIISNPPYVSADEMQELPDEYRHEPVTALESAENGLLHVERILREAKKYLSDSGILVVEVGNSKDALIDHCPSLPFTWIEFEHGGDGVFILSRAQL